MVVELFVVLSGLLELGLEGLGGIGDDDDKECESLEEIEDEENLLYLIVFM